MQKIRPIQKYTLAWGPFHLILNEFYFSPLPLRICEANTKMRLWNLEHRHLLPLCFTDKAFLQIKGKTLHQQDNYNSFDCGILLRGPGTKPAVSPRYACTWLLWFSCLVEFLIKTWLLFNWYIFSANNIGSSVSLLCFVSSMVSLAFASLPIALRWPSFFGGKRRSKGLCPVLQLSLLGLSGPLTIYLVLFLRGLLGSRVTALPTHLVPASPLWPCPPAAPDACWPTILPSLSSILPSAAVTGHHGASSHSLHASAPWAPPPSSGLSLSTFPPPTLSQATLWQVFKDGTVLGGASDRGEPSRRLCALSPEWHPGFQAVAL